MVGGGVDSIAARAVRRLFRLPASARTVNCPSLRTSPFVYTGTSILVCLKRGRAIRLRGTRWGPEIEQVRAIYNRSC